METEKGVWKPEVGKTCWFVYNDNVWEHLVEKVNDHSQAFIGKGFGWNDFRYLFPTPEAALASIKVYDLDGKEVVVSRDSGVLKELGAAKMLDAYLEALDVVVQSFKDYRSGKLSKDDFDKFIDQSIQTSDDMAARTAAFIDYQNAGERFAAMAAGNEDPCDPSAREITTPTDKRNGDHC